MQVDFTEACKEQLTRQQKKRVKDHRMDYDLRVGCKNDVPKVSCFFTSERVGVLHGGCWTLESHLTELCLCSQTQSFFGRDQNYKITTARG